MADGVELNVGTTLACLQCQAQGYAQDAWKGRITVIWTVRENSEYIDFFPNSASLRDADSPILEALLRAMQASIAPSTHRLSDTPLMQDPLL